MQDKMELEQLKAYYEEHGQGHVFDHIGELAVPARSEFLKQLRSIDLDKVDSLVEKYRTRKEETDHELRPAETVGAPTNDQERAERRKARNRGEELLRAGKVAAFLVAGGQGTRLGLPGPKGTFPIYPITGKSLFEVFAQKLLNLRARFGKPVPLYVMTSPANDEETRAYFMAFNYFGLDKKTVKFIMQGTLPSVDLWGKLARDQPGHVFESPNGHGGAIEAMAKNGMVRELLDAGYEELFYFQVDNVLARICDPVFVGFHNMREADLSTKVVEKIRPEEKVGVVGYIDGKPGVIEYSELSQKQLHDRRKDGRLRYNAGNTAIHCFSLRFLDNLISGNSELPYHFALKKMKNIDGEEVEVVKFEKFIFDAMKLAGRVMVFEVDRAQEFSPLKNAVGPDSPNTVKEDLQNLWTGWLEAAGVDVSRTEDGEPRGCIEISPTFADSELELVDKLPEGWEFSDGAVL
ncbi:MAG: UTP--glucose-1-phosphate uridylyltransferase [Planctomycetota bacterium]|nr:UTP--glucose-1-phosphate uridylyltransferase [Planctomycetota bacterium]